MSAGPDHFTGAHEQTEDYFKQTEDYFEQTKD
jgi:hypothetical protein